MDYVNLTYDLHGSDKAKDAFLEHLTSNGWYDHVIRHEKPERLPNTTLLTKSTCEVAERQVNRARDIARGLDAKFKLTHWSLGPYKEFYGGYDPAPLAERLEALKAKTRAT